MSTREHSVKSFRNSAEDFLKKIILLLEGKEDIIWGNPEKNLFQIVKAVGIRRNNNLTPLGKHISKVYNKTGNLEYIYSILRLQVVYYITEKDFKMPFLDILSFIRNNPNGVDVNNIKDFLSFLNYDLGENPDMTIKSYLLSFLADNEKCRYNGYLIKENKNNIYFVKKDKIITVDKLLSSYLYKIYKTSGINEEFYKNVYENYYLSDKIISKIIFFRYGIKNG